jgi:hypothetical protein
MSETMQGGLASGSLFTDLIKEIRNLYYSDFSEPSQFQKMIVTAHDIVGTSGSGTFKDSIVARVFFD